MRCSPVWLGGFIKSCSRSHWPLYLQDSFADIYADTLQSTQTGLDAPQGLLAMRSILLERPDATTAEKLKLFKHILIDDPGALTARLGLKLY